MLTLYRILAFAIVLGIIVLVHEFGHFIAARLMKVRVEAFSFGFGKRLFGKKIGHTDFRFSLIPLGGYVKLAGEEEVDKSKLKDDDFMAKNRGQRMFILFAGPLMNLILTFFILTVINITGVEMEKYKMEPAKIGYVKPGSPAENAGLKAGDSILAIDNRTIKNWKSLEIRIMSNPNENLKINYERQGQKYSTILRVRETRNYSFGYAGFYWPWPAIVNSMTPNMPAKKVGIQVGDVIVGLNGKVITNYLEFQDLIAKEKGGEISLTVKRAQQELKFILKPKKVEGRWMIGTGHNIPITQIRYGLLGSIGKSVDDMGQLITMIAESLKKLVIGKISPKNLSGPIEIAKFSQQAMEVGFSYFFMFIAFISLNLGIINLLPIPMLDGGHLLIFSVEALVRRDLNQRLKTILMYGGLVILVALMIFVILNDLAKTLPRGWKSLMPF